MTKYYRVIKDHPFWEVGAIISNERSSGSYYAVDDIWDKPGADGQGFNDFSHQNHRVENCPEWFERVYKSGIKQDKFVSREKALEAYVVTDVVAKTTK